MDVTQIEFIAHQDAARYLEITVDVARVLESWRDSIFSFEWLLNDGTIKPERDLPPREKPKRALVEEKLSKNQPLEKPILGIGINDNVEIGVGRAEFLTLAAHGAKTIPVYIPKSNESDFKEFLAEVN
ncbi:MAG: hypothetical protein KDJ35_07580 [Alphaproteobacteria bacterium]|nr:hypothetical protein [Alphaproteobacteria bacterium]